MFWTNIVLSRSLIMKVVCITNKNPAKSTGMAAVSLNYENVQARSGIKWWQLRVELLSLRGWIMSSFYFSPPFSIYCYLSLLWTLWFIIGLLGTPPARCSWLMVLKPNFRGSYNVCQLWRCCLPGLLSICIILQQAVNPSASCCPGV